MKTYNLAQGSPEWRANRASLFNASDAPAMMGVSPYKTRSALIRELATGDTPEVDVATQRLFDEGHRCEALARPLAEAIVGEDLYPVSGSADFGLSRPLGASFDGLTMGEDVNFEHKMLNDELRAAMVEGCTGADLPLMYRVQCEQQSAVSGARRTLFMASKWNGDKLVEERHCWYEPDANLLGQIIAGWDQLQRDVEAYVPAPAEPAASVGKAPETLPALHIELSGQVTASNLAEFKQTALTAIRAVNRDLKTDQDFADADKAVKWCQVVEARLAAAKEHALSQTASIDALFKTIDDISAEARQVRLELDKLVTKRKAEIKEGIIVRARGAWGEHLAGINAELQPLTLLVPQEQQPDFVEAAKNKRSVATLQDAVDTALANGKIAADALARDWRAKLTWYGEEAAQHLFLFSDLQQLVQKPADDFRLAVTARIDSHKATEAKKKAAADAAAQLAAQTIATAAAPKPVGTASDSERFHPGTRTLAVPATIPPPVAAPATPPWLPEPSLVSLLDDLLSHIDTAFDCKFRSHPKPSQEWWSELQRQSTALREATAA